MKILYIIPARGGSKGVPRKNVRLLNGKPLIAYSIEMALSVASAEDICVTTDDDEVIEVAKSCGLEVPFKRPAHLASDSAGSYEVLLHALAHYESIGRRYDAVMLLQPTSPFRTSQHLKDITSLYTPQLDMVVSVGRSHQNPYFNLFEEKADGFLEKSKSGHYEGRQAVPPVYFYNGSLYLINVNSLKEMPLSAFEHVKKFLMSDICSYDIDTMLDWAICETILANQYFSFDVGDANS